MYEAQFFFYYQITSRPYFLFLMVHLMFGRYFPPRNSAVPRMASIATWGYQGFFYSCFLKPYSSYSIPSNFPDTDNFSHDLPVHFTCVLDAGNLRFPVSWALGKHFKTSITPQYFFLQGFRPSRIGPGGKI